jgi:hypothetical protein
MVSSERRPRIIPGAERRRAYGAAALRVRINVTRPVRSLLPPRPGWRRSVPGRRVVSSFEAPLPRCTDRDYTSGRRSGAFSFCEGWDEAPFDVERERLDGAGVGAIFAAGEGADLSHLLDCCLDPRPSRAFDGGLSAPPRPTRSRRPAAQRRTAVRRPCSLARNCASVAGGQPSLRRRREGGNPKRLQPRGWGYRRSAQLPARRQTEGCDAHQP